MAKISIPDVTAGFSSVARINSSFQQVEDELNDKVLYRDNPTGEPNQMENDLDMNSNNVLNAGVVAADTLVIDGQTIVIGDAGLDGTVSPAYDNVTDMKASNSIVGQLVQTKGYDAIGDGGEGRYVIVASQAVDGITDHTLSNGNVALLLKDQRGLGNKMWQGSLLVWQRGVTFDTFTSRAGVADGWSYARSGFAAGSTISQQAGDVAQYAMRVLRDNADTSTASMNLVANMSRDVSMEMAGQPTILRVRAKKGSGYSATDDALAISVRYTTHTAEQSITLANGQYSTGDTFLTSITATLTTTTQDFYIAADIPSTATQVSVRIQAVPTGTAVANDYFQIEDCSWVIGHNSYELDQPTFQEALHMAQSEYYKSYSFDVTANTSTEVGALITTGVGTSTTVDEVFHVELPTSMRAPPTVTLYGTAGTSGVLRNITDSTNISATASRISTNGFTIEPSTITEHYEEGTFTPVFGSVTVTYTGQVGRYVRQGNLIYMELEIDYNTLNTTDTSDIQISGMPSAGTNGLGNFNVNLQRSTGFNFAATDYVTPTMFGTGTAIAFTSSTGTNWDYNDGKMNAAGKVVVAGTYLADNASGVKTLGVHYVAEARL